MNDKNSQNNNLFKLIISKCYASQNLSSHVKTIRAARLGDGYYVYYSFPSRLTNRKYGTTFISKTTDCTLLLKESLELAIFECCISAGVEFKQAKLNETLAYFQHLTSLIGSICND